MDVTTPSPRAAAEGGAAAQRWQRRSQLLLQVFAPVLILTGLGGFLIPPQVALMSGACPYNVFHLVAGTLGVLLALTRRPAAAALFNVGFGAIDLYQAVAGVAGLFPAALFALRPADHVVHLVLGLLLVVVGWLGRPRAEPIGARR
jgi:hypothetical protein